MKITRFFTIVLLFIYFLPYLSKSQTVTYDSIPRIYQLYPRNEADNDSAIVTIKGTETGGNFDSVTVDVDTNAVMWKRVSQNLVYAGGSASFLLKPKIFADTVEFRFTIKFWTTGTSFTDTIIDSVVSGDVFFIQGQSNAVGKDFGGFDPYKVEWVRSFGTSAGKLPEDSIGVKSDTTWDLGQAETINSHASIGIWGLRLGKLIAETYRIPVCFIMGAAGGTEIKQHLRNDNNPTSLATIYGRLLYKAQKANYTEKVKAIIWWQGESDAGNFSPMKKYYPKFKSLYNAWHKDYPNIQKIYTTQIHVGWSSNADRLREVQRIIPDSLANVEIMTSHNIGSHFTYTNPNRGHFGPNGYEKYADLIFRQISRDFYRATDTLYIDPPNITRAYYTSSQRNVLILEFNNAQSIFFRNDTIINSIRYFLKDHIYLWNSDQSVDTLVDSITVFDNKVRLSLTRQSNAVEVTYLPAQFYNNSSITYDGPWFTNSKGVSALSFYRYPIDSVFGDDPLPVELSSFSAFYFKGKVRLQWRTESEINNLGFILLRKSSLQESYVEIASYEYVPELNGQGTSNYPKVYEYIDEKVIPDETYFYVLQDVDLSGKITNHGPIKVTTVESAIPKDFTLFQNFPNPFNQQTTISFFIPKKEFVSIKIYDSLGQEVKILANDEFDQGFHNLVLDGQGLGSGTYFYTVSTSNRMRVKKMVLVK